MGNNLHITSSFADHSWGNDDHLHFHTHSTATSTSHDSHSINSVHSSQAAPNQAKQRHLPSFEDYFLATDIAKSAEYLNAIDQMIALRDRLGGNPRVITQPVLYRFLRARKFNPDLAGQFFEAHMNWRERNQVDQDFSFPEMDAVQDIYPHGFHKTDKEGRPVYYEVYKDVTLKELFAIASEERIRRYYMTRYEYMNNVIMPGCSIEFDKFVGRQVTILDLKNSKTSLHQAQKLITMVSTFSTENYPEIMHKLYVVNSPRIAQGLWKIIKLLLNDTINKKIEFLGRDYETRLLQEIDSENLPEFLGGTSQTNYGKVFRYHLGPWKQYEDVLLSRLNVPTTITTAATNTKRS